MYDVSAWSDVPASRTHIHKVFSRMIHSGSKVCPEWKYCFPAFVAWSFQNGYQEGYRLLRHDVSAPFSPDNCFWGPATSAHKRKYGGETSRKMRLYRIWSGIKQKCHEEGHRDFPRFGGRGIKVCEEWRHDFKRFESWSLSSGYREDLNLGRYDWDGNYTPENCAWMTDQEISALRKSTVLLTAFGKTMSLQAWSSNPLCLVSLSCLAKRIRAGMEPHRALRMPACVRTTRRKDAQSQYIGVAPHSQTGRWQANLGRKYLGICATEEEAARLYDRKAREIYGEWMLLNFPEEWPDPLENVVV